MDWGGHVHPTFFEDRFSNSSKFDEKRMRGGPTLLKVFGKNSLNNLYPNIFEVVRIVATLPVTVASCERAHSKVKIINNYLRASMSDERLESLVQISIERDMADRIELSSLVDKFKTTGGRKLPL